MPGVSAKRLFQTRSRSEGRTFLKYSSLPFGTRELKTHVLDVRESPKLNSPAVVDIRNQIDCDGKTVLTEATSIPLNFSNLKALDKLIGDDLSAARGMILIWHFSLKPNPNARPGDESEVMGFDLVDARLPPQAPELKADAPKKRG